MDYEYKQLELEFSPDDYTEEDDDDDEDLEEELVHKQLSDETIIEKYSNGQLRIVRTTMDFSLHNLNQVFNDSNYMDLSPSYQRRNRWDSKKKSLLIESFLMNIPVPPVFLFEKDYNSYEVMDGRQRLQSITEFLEDKFPLTSLEFWKELQGKYFSELPSVLQRGLLRRTLNAIVLLAESSKPGESNVDVRMVLFRRLNTGGIKLNPQELRNALYPGHFNDMLLSLSRTDIFTKIWSIPAKVEGEDRNPPPKLLKSFLYRSMGDCELVLRFFAIRETVELSLKGSLRKILDDCMVRHMSDSKSTVDVLSTLFLRTIESLYKLFEEKPFLLPNGKPSSPLFDSLMVAFSFIDSDTKLDSFLVRQRLETALSNKDNYNILIGKGNTTGAIQERVILASKILLGE